MATTRPISSRRTAVVAGQEFHPTGPLQPLRGDAGSPHGLRRAGGRQPPRRRGDGFPQVLNSDPIAIMGPFFPGLRPPRGGLSSPPASWGRTPPDEGKGEIVPIGCALAPLVPRGVRMEKGAGFPVAFPRARGAPSPKGKGPHRGPFPFAPLLRPQRGENPGYPGGTVGIPPSSPLPTICPPPDPGVVLGPF